VTVDRAIEQLVDERVRLALAGHQCACNRRGAAPRTAYTLPEIAKSLGISTRQIQRLAQSGELPSKLIGGRRVVLVDDFRQFLAAT